MAVHWPSRVSLTIRRQSSREAVLLPRHLRHQRRFLVSQVKIRNFFEKTKFLCSSTSIMIWWLSSKPGHSSTTAAKPRRLPKSESTCSSESALIFALSDVSRQLHCSSTATAAYLKFHTAPCSSTRGLLRPPAWLCASEYREAPGPPGGCVGFIGPLPFPHPPQLCLQERALSLDLAFPVPATRGLSATAHWLSPLLSYSLVNKGAVIPMTLLTTPQLIVLILD